MLFTSGSFDDDLPRSPVLRGVLAYSFAQGLGFGLRTVSTYGSGLGLRV